MAKNSTSITMQLTNYLKDKKQRTYFVSAVTFLFVLIIILGGVLPAYSAVVFQIEENKKRDEAIKVLDEQVSILIKYNQAKKNQAKFINYFNDLFLNENDQTKVVEDVNKWVADNNVILKNITFAERSSISTQMKQAGLSANVKPQLFTVNILGTREQLLEVIKDIEASERIYNIFLVNLFENQDQDTSRNYPYAATIQINYFIYDTEVKFETLEVIEDQNAQ